MPEAERASPHLNQTLRPDRRRTFARARGTRRPDLDTRFSAPSRFRASYRTSGESPSPDLKVSRPSAAPRVHSGPPSRGPRRPATESLNMSMRRKSDRRQAHLWCRSRRDRERDHKTSPLQVRLDAFRSTTCLWLMPSPGEHYVPLKIICLSLQNLAMRYEWILLPQRHQYQHRTPMSFPQETPAGLRQFDGQRRLQAPRTDGHCDLFPLNISPRFWRLRDESCSRRTVSGACNTSSTTGFRQYAERFFSTICG